MANRETDRMNRHYEIVSHICKVGKTTYSELMQRFQVSRQTIARDLKFISKEIISLNTSPGIYGGVSILTENRKAFPVKIPDSFAEKYIKMCELVKETSDVRIKKYEDEYFDLVEDTFLIFASFKELNAFKKRIREEIG